MPPLLPTRAVKLNYRYPLGLAELFRFFDARFSINLALSSSNRVMMNSNEPKFREAGELQQRLIGG
jgi:hypothetical protein